jgi:predicted Zn-dependent protease
MMRILLSTTGLLLLAGCVSAPTGPPEQVATSIVAAIDEDDDTAAEELWDRNAEESSEYRQQMYPVLYDAATERYVRGDVTGSTELLRFMAEHYPDAPAVAQAYAYSLFILRSGQLDPDPELVEELEVALEEARRHVPGGPAWFDLMETQVAIDRGRLTDANEAYNRFRVAWDGTPESLRPYVEDLGRYLDSH